jgi:pSer/pThr/pTyr-binding forkhead associated (FHA) protein
MDVGLVCDACSAFSPMGAFECVRCGLPVALENHRSKTSPERASSTDEGDEPYSDGEPVYLDEVEGSRPISHGANGPVPCPTCGVLVQYGHRFCFNCGGKMPALAHGGPPERDVFSEETKVSRNLPKGTQRPTMYFSTVQQARAKLTLIRGDGLDGTSFTLAGDEHLAGRVDVPLLFPDDPFLSPVHANFFYRGGRLVVRDEDSVNGVYVRITGGLEVPTPTRFLVGEQVLEVQAPLVPSDEAEPDGTYYFASPRRIALFRVVQTLRGGDLGRAVHAETEVVTIGREGNDIDFPEDPFISGQHAQLTWNGGKIVLTDLSSRNGTFVRVAGERELLHGDYVFMGQQLLRVEIV